MTKPQNLQIEKQYSKSQQNLESPQSSPSKSPNKERKKMRTPSQKSGQKCNKQSFMQNIKFQQIEEICKNAEQNGDKFPISDTGYKILVKKLWNDQNTNLIYQYVKYQEDLIRVAVFRQIMQIQNLEQECEEHLTQFFENLTVYLQKLHKRDKKRTISGNSYKQQQNNYKNNQKIKYNSQSSLGSLRKLSPIVEGEDHEECDEEIKNCIDENNYISSNSDLDQNENQLQQSQIQVQNIVNNPDFSKNMKKLKKQGSLDDFDCCSKESIDFTYDNISEEIESISCDKFKKVPTLQCKLINSLKL